MLTISSSSSQPELGHAQRPTSTSVWWIITRLPDPQLICTNWSLCQANRSSRGYNNTLSVLSTPKKRHSVQHCWLAHRRSATTSHKQESLTCCAYGSCKSCLVRHIFWDCLWLIVSWRFGFQRSVLENGLVLDLLPYLWSEHLLLL